MKVTTNSANMRRTHASLIFATLLGLLVPCWHASANEVKLSYLQGLLPSTVEPVAAEGPSLMGDQVSNFDGSLSFVHTDVTLPGIPGLAVQFTRRHTAGRSLAVRGELGDWDIETPRLTGVYAKDRGWIAGLNVARCTQFGAPASAIGAYYDVRKRRSEFWTWDPGQFWNGVFLQIPGGMSEEVITRHPGNPHRIQNGFNYPLTTKSFWQIGCLERVANSTGEGFVAVSPDGITYQFDWMSSRHLNPLRGGPVVLGRADYALLATLVVDRFGNWVRYHYTGTNPARLDAITSSDGREIRVTWNAQGRVQQVSDGSRSWSYVYSSQGDLASVIRPDGTQWQFNLRPLVHANTFELGEHATCDNPGFFPDVLYAGRISHPTGAIGIFKMRYVGHTRVNVRRLCRVEQTSTLDGEAYFTKETSAYWPRSKVALSLVAKKIAGPGIPALADPVPGPTTLPEAEPAGMTWRYQYEGGFASWASTAPCSSTRRVLITAPDGAQTRHTFGVCFNQNEGQLLKTEEGVVNGVAARSTHFRYRVRSPADSFPEPVGESASINSDFLATRLRPQDQRLIVQQGVTFRWEPAAGAAGLDSMARPTQAYHGNSQGHGKWLTTEYFDHVGKWVLGRVAAVRDNFGHTVEQTVHDGTSALPSAYYRFGLPVQTYSHWPDGQLWKAFDPLGRATTWANYHRGQARLFTHRDLAQESAVINNQGKPEAFTNAAGTTMSYGYDPMGRLARVSFPTEPNGGSYHDIAATFAQSAGAGYGLEAGHWTQTITHGRARTVHVLDALWRVRMKRTWDVDDIANTQSVVIYRYDHDGRKTFESYPQREISEVHAAVAGTTWAFDGLGRELLRRDESEHGALDTVTTYLGAFEKRVTNPRQNSTDYGFQAFDTPSEDAIWYARMPEDVSLAIERDIHGKPLAITRSGGGLAHTRRYVYDVHHRLCKTIEPEAGATVQAYDTAGNVAWRATGLALPNTTQCDQAAPGIDGRKIRHTYDARDRLETVAPADGSQATRRTYTRDSLLETIETSGGGHGSLRWRYTYNNRRLPVDEVYTWGDPASAWTFRKDWDAHGHAVRQHDPWGSLDLAPNALGQPRSVGTFVSGVRYHPNGQVAAYTAGNGIAFQTEQNLRGLPSLWQHAGVMQDRYAYDRNGNVTAITDELMGQTRSMPWYDGLDRLRQANGPWGAGSFTYDALDNMTTSTVGGRNVVHRHDAANRLEHLGGTLDVSIGYDANGNISRRGAATFEFDLANRLRSAPGRAQYAYDGHGRRNLVFYPGGDYAHFAYTQDGKLRASWRQSAGGSTRHIYLGDRLVAEVAPGSSVSYLHTDALGSPVARTGPSRTILNRTRYEPYGGTVAGSDVPRGIGFTGHVNDADTGLVYMQQRYYDPIAGRFLSVDPVTTDAKTGRSFNRYAHAVNNPYRFVDPDGRDVVSAIPYDMTSGGGGASDAFGKAGPQIAAAAQHVGAPAMASGVALVAGAGVGSKVATPTKQTGSYTNTHESGKTYDGKGSKERSQESGRRVEKETGDRHTATDWTPASTPKDALKQESVRLDSHGGPKSPDNHNKIESPGKKLREQDK